MDREEFKTKLECGITFSDDIRRDIITKSITRCSRQVKTIVCMEECSELIQQLSKYCRGEGDHYSLLEELADVYICLRMIQNLYGVSDVELDKAVDVKLAREKERNDYIFYGKK